MRKILALSLFLFMWVYANGQDITARATLLQSKLDKALADTNRISLLIQLGDLYRSSPQSNGTRAIDYYRNALSLSTKINSISWINLSVKNLSRQYAKLNDFKSSRRVYLPYITYDQAHGYFKKEITLLEVLKDGFGNEIDGKPEILKEVLFLHKLESSAHLQLKDTLNAIADLKEEGDINLNLGNLDTAESELLSVVKQYKAIHYPKIHHTYFLLSAVSHLKGDIDKELDYRIEMVKGMLATADTSVLPLFYTKLCATYLTLGMYDKSMALLQKLLVHDEAVHQVNYRLFYNICFIFNREKKPLEAIAFLHRMQKQYPPKDAGDYYFLNKSKAISYLALHNNHLAEQYLLAVIWKKGRAGDAISLYNEQDLPDLEQICNFYLALKNYQKAAYYLTIILAQPHFVSSKLTASNIQLLQFKVDSAYGHYPSAIMHFQSYKKITDSIFNTTKSQQIQNVEIKYETAQKDKDITILKSQAQVSTAILEKKRVTNNLLLSGSILLLLLLGALYNRFLIRKKNILLLESKQTEISKKNKALEQLLDENELLLREVHHRVKNNLHMIVSLLNSQSKFLKDDAALTAILDSQHRVQAMSLIHQKLYKTNNASSIYMPEYINELVDYLKDSFKTRHQILFSLEIAPVTLDVLQAIPIGLILNETITNCIKYAFPFSENDTIKIELSYQADGELFLLIADNGRGMPDSFNMGNSDSFGMLLVQGLIEDLGGSLFLTTNNGTSVKITFNTVHTMADELSSIN